MLIKPQPSPRVEQEINTPYATSSFDNFVVFYLRLTFIIPAFRAVIDFTEQWFFFAKTGNEVTSPDVEAAKNRHPGRNTTDTPYVPLNAVNMLKYFSRNNICKYISTKTIPNRNTRGIDLNLAEHFELKLL
jgi:hypothetical protein